MKLQLGIFVKEPVPGEVKTRLNPPLTLTQAAELYRVALHETITRFQNEPYEVILFFSGNEEYFEKAFPCLTRIRQSEGDLGRRLAVALNCLHCLRPGAAALIGSDSPDLPLAQVDVAFAALEKVDVVTIPARDGGYVMIGTRQGYPQIFQDINWSSEVVLVQTRQRAVDAGLDYIEQGGWDDVDDIASLQRLLIRSPESETADHIRQHLGALVAI